MKIFKLDLVLSLLVTLLVGLKRLIDVKNQKFKSTLKHMNPIIPDPEAVVQPSKPKIIQTTFCPIMKNTNLIPNIFNSKLMLASELSLDCSSQNDSQKYQRYVEDTSMLIRISFIWTWTRNKLLRHFTFYRSIWM